VLLVRVAYLVVVVLEPLIQFQVHRFFMQEAVAEEAQTKEQHQEQEVSAVAALVQQ